MSGRPDVRTISFTLCSKNTSGVQRRFRKSFAAAVVIVAVVKRARTRARRRENLAPPFLPTRFDSCFSEKACGESLWYDNA